MTRDVYIGLGANLGDRAAALKAALAAMESHPAIAGVRSSAFYETAPLANAEQPMYLNAVARIKTAMEPLALLATLQEIETQLGRVRTERRQSRTMDLDVLLYGDAVIEIPALTVPHPEMHLRSFVLRGLCELDEMAKHPVLHRTSGQLYARLNGRDFVRDTARPQLISIAGMIGVGKTTLATRLADQLDAKLICEKYDENPFLAEVYDGRQDKALDSELFFLSSSATQLRRKRLREGRRYVSDYAFDKALVYASSWLRDTDLNQYRKHYEVVAESVVSPVAVIYLHDSIEQCLDRIHRRNRPYEQRIEPAFLETLNEKYEMLYTDWTACPLIRMSASECVTSDQAAAWAGELRHYLAAENTR